jgi:hypothetical protein
MNAPTLVDLTGKNGVTLIVQYENVVSPFAVFITDETGRQTFYYRIFDKPQLTLNLPVHSQKIYLRHIGNPQLKSTMIAPLNKLNLKYTFNPSKVKKRSYSLAAVTWQKVSGLPYGSPARFFFNTGLMQVDENRMSILPQPVRQFIQCHELAHYYYEDEVEADRFALYQYLNQGYNFSTAFNSLFDYLTPSGINVTRILSLFAEIMKLHKIKIE